MQKEKYYLQVIENNSPNNKYEDLQFEHAYNLYDLIFRIGAREGYRHVVNVEQENETTHIITFDNQILNDTQGYSKISRTFLSR
jgi:hypothetical protein